MSTTTANNPKASVLDETRMSFAEAAKLIPGRYGDPTRQTVRRWAVVGVLVGTARVKLEAARVAGTWYTSREAVARFIDRMNPNSDPTPARTPTQATRAAHTAGKKLAARGL